MAQHKMYLTKFKVTGRGRFPFDMLRYDHCYPVSGQDAAMLDCDEQDRLYERTVELIMVSPMRHGPESDRWWSFGWSVDRASITDVV